MLNVPITISAAGQEDRVEVAQGYSDARNNYGGVGPAAGVEWTVMGSLTEEEERHDGGSMGEEQPVLTSFQMARPVSLSETIGVACAQAVPVESLALAEWESWAASEVLSEAELPGSE